MLRKALMVAVCVITLSLFALWFVIPRIKEPGQRYSFSTDLVTYAIEHENKLPVSWDEFSEWKNKQSGWHWTRYVGVIDLNWGGDIVISSSKNAAVIVLADISADRQLKWNELIAQMCKERIDSLVR